MNLPRQPDSSDISLWSAHRRRRSLSPKWALLRTITITLIMLGTAWTFFAPVAARLTENSYSPTRPEVLDSYRNRLNEMGFSEQELNKRGLKR